MERLTYIGDSSPSSPSATTLLEMRNELNSCLLARNSSDEPSALDSGHQLAVEAESWHGPLGVNLHTELGHQLAGLQVESSFQWHKNTEALP